jgi:protein-tyrosine phosphatase
VDDGAADEAAAIAMATAAVKDGISRCVVTPHWGDRSGEAERLRAAVDRLRGTLRERNVALEVFPGNEVVLLPGLLPALKEGNALSLAGSSYVLLETAQLESEAFREVAIFQLQASGYRIVLAHPERVQSWQKDSGPLRELLERGLYVQVNAGSLRGDFGSAARRAAEVILRRGWASFLASDGHSPAERPMLLEAAYQKAAEWLGERAAQELVEGNPARVLCNELVESVEIEEPERRPWYSFLWRRR